MYILGIQTFINLISKLIKPPSVGITDLTGHQNYSEHIPTEGAR